jgi:hypothetical protein
VTMTVWNNLPAVLRVPPPRKTCSLTCCLVPPGRPFLKSIATGKSLWSSRSLFPRKSDFGGQRQNGRNVCGGQCKKSRDQGRPGGKRQYGVIWRRPRKSLRRGE